jgi:hypothetical protein
MLKVQGQICMNSLLESKLDLQNCWGHEHQMAQRGLSLTLFLLVEPAQRLIAYR